ncbi:MAG TPA: beta-1,6-N-acetylglucosaminyltransferase [Flavipsychrobacter sp.]|nr:beta-1,6-N-acetylglucosaminyltransferase [Flavipsychrobacter sp.]
MSTPEENKFLPTNDLRIAHLIITHKDPEQLEKLINALSHPAFDLYIHVDKKSDINAFSYLAGKKNISFIKNRTKIYWAGYGTIQATINGFREILPEKYDYINVISSQDFPIKSAEYIYQYLAKQNGREYITCESIDGEWNVAPRVRNYHFINWRIPGKFRLEKIANKILPKRKFPFDYEIVGRANWFTLTKNASQYIIDFLDKHPEMIRYFKYCWGADEFMFSTILYNSHFKDQIVDNLVYVDWVGSKSGPGHPKILTSEDFEALKASDKLFARKFDIKADAVIFDKLENWIGSGQYTDHTT